MTDVSPGVFWKNTGEEQYFDEANASKNLTNRDDLFAQKKGRKNRIKFNKN